MISLACLHHYYDKDIYPQLDPYSLRAKSDNRKRDITKKKSVSANRKISTSVFYGKQKRKLKCVFMIPNCCVNYKKGQEYDCGSLGVPEVFCGKKTYSVCLD